MFLRSQPRSYSKNNKRRLGVNYQNKIAFSLTSQSSRTKRFSLRELKTGSFSWITSTRLQAESSTLACPRGSHPARGTRVYSVWSIKKNMPFHLTMKWLRTHLSVILLRSSLMCLRGSRSIRRRRLNLTHVHPEVVCFDSRLV